MKQPRINNFLDADGKIKIWPSKTAMRQEVLKYLSGKFECGRTYTEKEVNDIIIDWHTFSDFHLLRRGMIDEKLLSRTPNGASYWKNDAEQSDE